MGPLLPSSKKLEDAFSSIATIRGVARGHVGIVEVVAVVLAVVDCPLDDRIVGIRGQELFERMDHAMLGSGAELVEQGLGPSCGPFGAIGVKMAGAAPVVLAAVIEVQGFARVADAVLDQTPYPDGAVGHDENFCSRVGGPGSAPQSAARWRIIYPSIMMTRLKSCSWILGGVGMGKGVPLFRAATRATMT